MPPARRGFVRRQLRAPYAAVVGALVGFWLSLTPSLMPRAAGAQALISAVCACAGYGLGALVGWLVRRCGVRPVGRARRAAWWVLAVVGGIGCIVALWLGLRWENEVRRLVGVDRVGLLHVLVSVALTAVLAVVLLLVARAVKAVGRVAGRLIATVMPAVAATLLGGLIAAVAAYVLVVDVGGGRLVGALDATFRTLNDEFRTDLPKPTSPDVSAGPRSGQSWNELGRQGRLFVVNTPTAEQVSAFTGEPSLHPVRAYIGAGADGVDLEAEARRAVTELEALGGFDRAVLNVATGTGRGWVNENQAQALEYMWGGDTATVSMQYSYLPSWMSFLLDGDRAQDAGRTLFDAVYAHWQGLQPAHRPLLVVSGESLGSFGGEAAFSDAHDLATRTSGALFVGPTANNVLWSRFTSHRDPGTPQVLPVLDRGATVRFADVPADWERPGPWTGVRIGYLQHANDPITWWSWELAVRRPDWLEEPPGRGVSPHLHWIPGVTMLQLGVDQFAANSVPDGEGHEFGQSPAYAWAKILPPARWTDADTAALAELLRSNPAPR
ncbi:alpha/beta hydrolase [Nocardioides terrae]|nr:alpha/beta-hydrolase family protein [Nocardioides terrae]